MEKFGASKNFIIMDDDYFIGKSLNKSDFFYVENNKVIPKIVATEFREETKESIEKELNYYKKEIKTHKDRQTTDVFLHTEYLTLLSLYEIFKKSLIVPAFTHAAIPCNKEYIKEMYDLVYNSKYKEKTLDFLYRTPETLQFQNFYMTYMFNKYNTKVGPISRDYIDLKDAFNVLNNEYNIPLFVINTDGYDYEKIYFKKAKLAMEHRFPEPTPYEIINHTDIIYLSVDVIKEIENGKNKYKKNSQFIFILSIIEFIIILILSFYIYRKIRIKMGNSKIDFIRNENKDKNDDNYTFEST